jgi:hypothetical protein
MIKIKIFSYGRVPHGRVANDPPITSIFITNEQQGWGWHNFFFIHFFPSRFPLDTSTSFSPFVRLVSCQPMKKGVVCIEFCWKEDDPDFNMCDNSNPLAQSTCLMSAVVPWGMPNYLICQANYAPAFLNFAILPYKVPRKKILMMWIAQVSF